MRKHPSKRKVASNQRIGEKIELLRHEGIPQRQAIGEAEGMERSGRLKRHGRYIRKGKRKGGSRV